MKYKVGDKVVIKSIEAIDATPEDQYGNGVTTMHFYMREFCGKVCTISSVDDTDFRIKEDLWGYYFGFWMIAPPIKLMLELVE